ncbi:Chz1p ASCRUDRAFT_72103 [Ascoidea rubescens DSM 1968]|uniref:Histone H2A.Z-specific chaperone CHZ1 n=1 Tax=Ascoidea rubescens DSM 1968 TaxID=1344418 RepID=A0A1D2VBF3_9ASCO|nr:hypothetical protein ASCRUDRAFT_72103 [Ascoidea rubescens DSM 1968]ODV59024.1 hypothetical protein ASCRUDRAFT_72103 [Ascoidea rubescens DSM 1968]
MSKEDSSALTPSDSTEPPKPAVFSANDAALDTKDDEPKQITPNPKKRSLQQVDENNQVDNKTNDQTEDKDDKPKNITSENSTNDIIAEETGEKAKKRKRGHKHKHRHRRSKYRNETQDQIKEDDDDQDENGLKDEDYEKLVIEDDLNTVEDDLSEIDPSNIITGARTRGKVIDFTKTAEKLGGLKKFADANDENDNDYDDPDDEDFKEN